MGMPYFITDHTFRWMGEADGFEIADYSWQTSTPKYDASEIRDDQVQEILTDLIKADPIFATLREDDYVTIMAAGVIQFTRYSGESGDEYDSEVAIEWKHIRKLLPDEAALIKEIEMQADDVVTHAMHFEPTP